MAKLVSAPQRFTHAEWTLSNKTKYAEAEDERQAAERLIAESDRLSDETEKRRERTQRDVGKKLEQRLQDIQFWKHELEQELEAVHNEIDSLLAFKVRIEKAIEAVAEPLHIASQCLANREKRISIDLVHDDVEKELRKEVEVYEGVLNLLHRTKEQADEQLRLNRKAKFYLEKDLKDKFSAQSIDNYCTELRNNSSALRSKPGAAKVEANSVTPEDWQDFSDENIKRAERERFSSVNLRSMIDGILQQTTNDMREQCEKVNLAFKKRIAETKDTKAKLEEHLQKVLGQMQDIQENADKLEKSIMAKENPLKLAETRLDERAQRPNVELCRDAVQYRLIEEVGELNESVARLQQRLGQTRDSLKGLTRRQLDLEEDISVKSNTLFCDEVECMGMRQSINIETF